MSFYASEYGNIILSDEDFKRILDLTRMNVMEYQNDLLRVTKEAWKRYENQSGRLKKSMSDIVDDYMEEQDNNLPNGFPWDVDDFASNIFWAISRAKIRKKSTRDVQPIAEDFFVIGKALSPETLDDDVLDYNFGNDSISFNPDKNSIYWTSSGKQRMVEAPNPLDATYEAFTGISSWKPGTGGVLYVEDDNNSKAPGFVFGPLGHEENDAWESEEIKRITKILGATTNSSVKLSPLGRIGKNQRCAYHMRSGRACGRPANHLGGHYA